MSSYTYQCLSLSIIFQDLTMKRRCELLEKYFRNISERKYLTKQSFILRSAVQMPETTRNTLLSVVFSHGGVSVTISVPAMAAGICQKPAETFIQTAEEKPDSFGPSRFKSRWKACHLLKGDVSGKYIRRVVL